MLVALLVVLGVNLVVVVAVAGLVFGRRRWLKHQPGVFAGAVRVSSGDIDGLGSKWKRGHGRWVSDVLVWTKAPLLLRNELIPIDRIARVYSAPPGTVRRLGEEPVIIEFACDTATVAVAARAKHRGLVTGARTPTVAPIDT